MYHPSRGGVRGGRDQFKWDDVKVDKHRENYIGHSLKAPVGRWQKGKDLFWYTRDKNSAEAEAEAAKEEIRKIKEQEEQAMRELLGLAPKSSNRQQGSRLTKHEYADLLKKGSTVEEGDSYAEASRVPGIGFAKGPSPHVEFESSYANNTREIPSDVVRGSIQPRPNPQINRDADPGESKKKRDRKESKQEKHEERHRSFKEKGKEKSDKGKRRRHDSDSD